jgi:hypothetical protein
VHCKYFYLQSSFFEPDLFQFFSKWSFMNYYFLMYSLFFHGMVSDTLVPRFEMQAIDTAVSIGYGLAIGDVDGDRKPDILLADKKQFVWYRNGDWKRFVMIDDLTLQDNVCIAARDLDGDGKVEVAVGAQWNPGETSDEAKSGSVHFLVRPGDPRQLWTAIELQHEPTIHRMRWVKSSGGSYFLVVLPLHGRGNKNGEGQAVKMIAYQYPKNPAGEWKTMLIDQSMHMTHNFDPVENVKEKRTDIYIAGKEGIKMIHDFNGGQAASISQNIQGLEKGAGEVRVGNRFGKNPFIAAIEPMHGTTLAVYSGREKTRTILNDQLKEGHALATADVLGLGYDQVIAGWRMPDATGKTGIKLYVPADNSLTSWKSYWIDENGMATEDLQVWDLNGDGKPEIIAAGRATRNLKIYWNRN